MIGAGATGLAALFQRAVRPLPIRNTAARRKSPQTN